MKKTFFPFVTFLLLSLIFVSCEKEAIDTTDTQQINLTSSVDSQTPPCLTGEYDLFERQLQWLSYIAGETLSGSSTAQSELVNYFNNQRSNSIDAEDLVGPNAVLSTFSSDFHDFLIWHIENPYGWPSNQTTPTPPVNIGGTPIGTPAEALATMFYDNMLVNNCVEIYLPVGLNFVAANSTVTATSHPLTNATCNEGIEWITTPLAGSQSFGVTVDQGYLSDHVNVLVTRPVRSDLDTIPSDPCVYSQYPGVDFTVFLD